MRVSQHLPSTEATSGKSQEIIHFMMLPTYLTQVVFFLQVCKVWMGSLKTSRGSARSNYCHNITKMLFAFPRHSLRSIWWGLPKATMTCGLSADWMQKQMWESSYLLLNHTSEICKSIKQYHSFQFKYFFHKNCYFHEHIFLIN